MNGQPLADELLDLAVDVAQDAGHLVKDRRAAVGAMAVTRTKTTPTDVVTDSDTAAEELIRSRLLDARPADGILGEEGGTSAGSSSVVWVVDPIDGTVNYLYGIPSYAVSIAARVDGELVAGVVVNPVTEETWTATLGGGAFLNGERIQHSGAERLDRALVATGFGYDARRRARQAHVLAQLMSRVRDIRRIGAAALDLCAVACGRVDAYYERGLSPWDLAAGELIVREAGGMVAGLQGRPAGADLVIAAGPALFGQLHDVLEPLEPDRD